MDALTNMKNILQNNLQVYKKISFLQFFFSVCTISIGKELSIVYINAILEEAN